MPPSPLPRTGRWSTFVRRPSASRYPTAARPGSSAERRNSVSRIPAGSHTRSQTRSWNGTPLVPLCHQREDDVAAVAVREPFVRLELRVVTVEHAQVALRRREFVDWDGHDV